MTRRSEALCCLPALPQLLRIQIEATGTARRLCAPREAVVQRAVEHTSEHGIIRVMFGSVEEVVGEEPRGRRSSSLWAKPVRATVRGGYTISPQAHAQAVPESLVTLILQVRCCRPRPGICTEFSAVAAPGVCSAHSRPWPLPAP